MITVEAVTEITEDQTLRIGLPKSVKPGPYRVVVVIEETRLTKAAGPLRLTKLQLAGWAKDSTFRREDIYGDTRR
ncbi:MAG: hypothetical protein ACYDH9_03230 [Limisphaerales bacterium]